MVRNRNVDLMTGLSCLVIKWFNHLITGQLCLTINGQSNNVTKAIRLSDNQTSVFQKFWVSVSQILTIHILTMIYFPSISECQAGNPRHQSRIGEIHSSEEITTKMTKNNLLFSRD